MPNVQEDLIEQLEQAFAHSDMRQRAETLRRVTDLFVFNAGKFTDEQIELFDEVMSRLVQEIDVSARAVSVRPEIPRQHLLALFAQASEAVRRSLEAADLARGGLLQEVIAQASNRLQTELREVSTVYSSAREHVVAMQREGKLDEAQLAAFASAGRFDEATVALSLMADLPIGMVERAIANQRTEQILVLAKAIGLGWDTTKAVLLLQA